MKKQQTTNNIAIPNKDLEILKKHFSNCFDKGGNFDIEKFKKELSKNEIDFSKEGYGIDWLGKNYARLIASDNATTLLKGNKDWNKKDENKDSKNLLIKGDNLEVLKHLSNNYYEKIKIIYIDPPYNTGSDGFVYQDDRKFTVKELSKLAGIDEEKAKRILEFTQSKSNSHSAWLTFMYPRLYIAKQLLKDEGVIFISIDDNEVAQLRLLMDEIFGEENSLDRGTLIWVNKGSTKGFNKIVKNHEYILAYGKNASLVKSFYGKNHIDELDIINERLQIKRTLKNPTSQVLFPKGIKIEEVDNTLFENSVGGKTGRIDIINNNRKMIFENGRLKHDIILEAAFPYKNQMIKFFKNDGEVYDFKGQKWLEVYFKKTGIPYFKKERNTKIISSILDDCGNSGLKDVEKLNIPFNNPKPVNLIEKIIDYFSSNEDVILDFFAGSGTTGEAVMQLNSDTKGNRKYILVQLPEEINPQKDKISYDFVKKELKIKNPTIFDITKERLYRSAKKIKEDKEKTTDIDFGFKIFETIPIWEDYNFDTEEFSSQTKLFNESNLRKEDLQILLTTWKTYDGIPLTQDLKEINLDGYTGYYFDNKLYLIDKGFKTKNLKKLLTEIDENKEFNPAIVIVFGYNFESKVLREIAENIKNYSNKKNMGVDFVTRY
ncbi:site-specific DNA-methyltransferase [Candidatus Woesearchaeota archaeon]|nr:site-specific DNA-methyltransferase [Candidatus Woesearchaeota archaeon]